MSDGSGDGGGKGGAWVWSPGAESEGRGRRPKPSRLTGVSEVAAIIGLGGLLVWGLSVESSVEGLCSLSDIIEKSFVC